MTAALPGPAQDLLDEWVAQGDVERVEQPGVGTFYRVTPQGEKTAPANLARAVRQQSTRVAEERVACALHEIRREWMRDILSSDEIPRERVDRTKFFRELSATPYNELTPHARELVLDRARRILAALNGDAAKEGLR